MTGFRATFSGVTTLITLKPLYLPRIFFKKVKPSQYFFDTNIIAYQKLSTFGDWGIPLNCSVQESCFGIDQPQIADLFCLVECITSATHNSENSPALAVLASGFPAKRLFGTLAARVCKGADCLDSRPRSAVGRPNQSGR